MNTPDEVVLMAAYNAAMNHKLYTAAAGLSPGELTADRKAFFGSLHGTLNHLLAADTIWLTRFASHPAAFPALDSLRGQAMPAGLLTHSYGADLPALLARRLELDDTIARWAAQVTAADLAHALAYRNTAGTAQRKRFGSVVLHFFNHQTHHRGQASTLLTQAGADIGVTDLLALIPNLEPT